MQERALFFPQDGLSDGSPGQWLGRVLKSAACQGALLTATPRESDPDDEQQKVMLPAVFLLAIPRTLGAPTPHNK